MAFTIRWWSSTTWTLSELEHASQRSFVSNCSRLLHDSGTCWRNASWCRMKKACKVTKCGASPLFTWFPFRICLTMQGPYRSDCIHAMSIPLFSMNAPMVLSWAIKICSSLGQRMMCLRSSWAIRSSWLEDRGPCQVIYDSLSVGSHHLHINCQSLLKYCEQRASLMCWGCDQGMCDYSCNRHSIIDKWVVTGPYRNSVLENFAFFYFIAARFSGQVPC